MKLLRIILSGIVDIVVAAVYAVRTRINRLLPVIALLTVLVTVALGQSSTIRFIAQWDPNPSTESVVNYRVWLSQFTDGTGTLAFTNAATVPHTNGVLKINWQIPASDWGKAIRVTAVNSSGLESDPSITLLIPTRPSNPKNAELLKLTN